MNTKDEFSPASPAARSEAGFDLPQGSPAGEQSGLGLTQNSPAGEQSGLGLPQNSPAGEQSGLGLTQNSPAGEQSGLGLSPDSPAEAQSGLDLPSTARGCYDLGVELRRSNHFGEAINAFARAADLAFEEITALQQPSARAADLAFEEITALQQSASQKIFAKKPASRVADHVSQETVSTLESLRSCALASIELIREINGFVNTDLMNP